MLFTFIIQSPTQPGAMATASSVIVSSGSGDANKAVLTRSDGLIDPSLLPSGSTSDLQSAYNGGSTIITSALNGPVTLKGYDQSSLVFYIKDSTDADVLKVTADKNVEVGNTVQAVAFTSAVQAVVASNQSASVVETYNLSLYRAIQYSYTARASDNSGYETGQVYIIHDGTNASYIHSIGAAIGTPLAIVFAADISGGNLRLLASTDSSPFSRVVDLFKIVLPNN